MELITCMHEESAAAMAHGYFKISDRHSPFVQSRPKPSPDLLKQGESSITHDHEQRDTERESLRKQSAVSVYHAAPKPQCHQP